MNILRAILEIIANALGLAKERSAAANTEKQVASVMKVEAQQAKDATAVNIDKASAGDVKSLEEIRKDLAE